MSLAYFVALPLTLAFFQNFQVDYLEEQLEVGKTLAFITKLLLGFGFIFELPVVVMILSVMGLVTPEFLKSKRRHAIVLITVAGLVPHPWGRHHPDHHVDGSPLLPLRVQHLPLPNDLEEKEGPGAG